MPVINGCCKTLYILLVIAVGFFMLIQQIGIHLLQMELVEFKRSISCFFAYIGFDAISTTAEECKNPQRDLPKGMMWAIIICTILYIAIALV
jgi:amino acid transporter